MFDGKQLVGWSLLRSSKVESVIQDGVLRLKAVEGGVLVPHHSQRLHELPPPYGSPLAGHTQQEATFSS